MEARLHGPDRDAEDIGNFAVFQALIVGQDDHLPEEVGQALDARTHALPQYFPLGEIYRSWSASLEQLHEAANLPIAHVLVILIQAQRLVAAIAAQGVDGLVGGDGIEPGAY